jgi:hypothetical protein
MKWTMILLGVNITRHDIGRYTRLAGALCPSLLLFFGIREKRNKELHGIMTFGQDVETGLMMAVIQMPKGIAAC